MPTFPDSSKQSSLIPRTVLFGNPEVTAVKISPDGKWISWLAPFDNILNLWVAPADDLAKARVLTHDRGRGVRSYEWSYNNTTLTYLQDDGGDDNWHLHAVDLHNKTDRDLTPLGDVNVFILQSSPKRPDELLIGINHRDPKHHDVYLLNIRSGGLSLVREDHQGMIGWIADWDLQLRLSSRYLADGRIVYESCTEADQPRSFLEVPFDDTFTTGAVGIDASGSTVYFLDSLGRNTAALVSYNIATRERTVLASHDKADIEEFIVAPLTGKPVAAAASFERREWIGIELAVKEEFAWLQSQTKGDLAISSQTLDQSLWLIEETHDDGPVRYYLFDRRQKALRFLMTSRPILANFPLVKKTSVVIPSRDGLELVSYLSLPNGSRNGGAQHALLPMVLLVHGGPWARDRWGFDSYHQLLSNRGYAVLSVNFRSSLGFGKSFANAGNFEWGRKMHDDLLDAVDWAVRTGIADPKRIAIMGGSYGGYSTLVGLTFTPEVFACGVDFVGPSNLLTLLETIPPYWTSSLQLFIRAMGDPQTPEGRRLLEERSPLNFVDRIRRPLLIAQGANDPRVKQSESDQIVKAMSDRNIPVTYVLFPDEGHGFVRKVNSLAFVAAAEAFLAKHLGGRAEAVGDAFSTSTIQIMKGEVP